MEIEGHMHGSLSRRGWMWFIRSHLADALIDADLRGASFTTCDGVREIICQIGYATYPLPVFGTDANMPLASDSRSIVKETTSGFPRALEARQSAVKN
jgi:hypothetical protein